MEKVTVTTNDDAPVLIPNPGHGNFTESGKVIPKNTTIEGERLLCKGHRRGLPFEYKIFRTTDKQIIFQKFINNENMETNTTEVKLGADAQVTPATPVAKAVTASSKKTIIIGTVVGLGAGYAIARYKKWDRKKTIISTLVCGAIGFAAGYMMSGKPSIVIKAKK